MCEPMSLQRMLDGPSVEEMESAQQRVLVGETLARSGRDWSYWGWVVGLAASAGIIHWLRMFP